MYRSYATNHGIFGAGSGGGGAFPPITPDTQIVTVADYATMIGSAPTVDTVFVVTDASGDPSGDVFGTAHYTYDVATTTFTIMPKIFKNGLHYDGTFGIHWGGLLTEGTTIDGDSQAHSLTFTDIDTFQIQNGTDVDISATNVLLNGINSLDLVTTAAGEINIRTPNIATATASNGQILTLINDASGRAERADVPAATPIPAWVNNALEVNTGVIQWGGVLVKDTTVDGVTNTYDVDFLDVKDFTVTNAVNTTFTSTTSHTIDVGNGNIFLADGTTSSGSGTAQAGYVFTCVNGATGRGKRAPMPEFRYAVRQDANGGTQIVGGGIGTFVAMQYDTETIPNGAFTLGAGGVITCNVSDDYRINIECNLGTIPGGGGTSVFVVRLYVNGLAAQDLAYQTLERNSEFQSITYSLDQTLNATDTFEIRVIRNGGSRGLTTTSGSNRLFITSV